MEFYVKVIGSAFICNDNNVILEEKNLYNGKGEKIGVKNYTINEDLSVDVDGDLQLTKKGTGLTSLKGCPEYIGGDFDCSKLFPQLNPPTITSGLPTNVVKSLLSHSIPPPTLAATPF